VSVPALKLKFRGRSADQWVMPTDPIIIIVGGGLLAWLFFHMA
jgi:hypothetical protein